MLLSWNNSSLRTYALGFCFKYIYHDSSVPDILEPFAFSWSEQPLDLKKQMTQGSCQRYFIHLTWIVNSEYYTISLKITIRNYDKISWHDAIRGSCIEKFHTSSPLVVISQLRHFRQSSLRRHQHQMFSRARSCLSLKLTIVSDTRTRTNVRVFCSNGVELYD